MICPHCRFEQDDANTECLKCGIVFRKYRGPGGPEPETGPAASKGDSGRRGKETAIEDRNWIKDIFFHEEPLINPFYFGGRALLFIVVMIWGWMFIFSPMESNAVGKSFWHLVNLPFHEAGHIIFRPLGRFMASLGGSLGQLLMPLVCLGAFLLFTRDAFAGSVSLWWFGENLMDLAPYINDARALQLPLLGGNIGLHSPYGFHDWEFILKETGLLRYDHTLAMTAHGIGIALMILSFTWGGYLLYKQYRNLDW